MKPFSRRFGAFLLLFGSTLLGGCTYARVGSGQVAVVRTPEGMSKQTLPTGDWRIGGDDIATVYNARSQEHGEELEVLASNGLKIVLDASIRFHIVEADVLALDREVGGEYYSILLGPTLRSQARRVVGRFQPEEIYSSQRELIERQIREGIDTAIGGRHIVVEAVLIRNVRLPEAIQSAINTKLEAEQAALKMKFVLAQAAQQNEKEVLAQKAEAERSMIMAQASADSLRLNAKARADVKRLEGEAQDAFQRSIQLHLSPSVLDFYRVEALKSLGSSPNSKLVFLGGNGRAPQTTLDLRSATAGVENPY